VELSEALKWEARQDGMYLTVFPEHAGEVDLSSLKESFFNDDVMNFDLPRIEQVIREGRGRPEFVGPCFIRFDRQKKEHVTVFSSPKIVKIKIWSSIVKAGLEVSVKEVEFLLARENVIHGIDWAVVSRIVNNKIYDEEIIVAKATDPVDGQDAKIKELVQVDPDAKPLLNSDGSVDFRNLENIHQVEKGDIIAQRVPPTPGKSGVSVFGQPLLAKPGKDAFLPRGENTEISKDNLELVASCSGYLYREHGNICVGKLFVLPGDVSFKSGNIQYSGEVIVRGNVLSDFKVVADGNITIEGSVEGAEITSNEGSVIIKNGVFGRGKAIIKAKKDIQVHMVQDSTLICEGELKVSKYLMECRIKVNSLDASARNCIVSSSSIEAFEQVQIAQVGSKGARATSVLFLDRETEKVEDKFKELNVLFEKIQQSIASLETRLKTMKSIMKKMEVVSDRSRDELKKVLAEYAASQKKLEFVDKKRKALAVRAEKPLEMPGTLMVQFLMPSLDVKMYGVERSFRDEAKGVLVEWKDGQMSVRSGVNLAGIKGNDSAKS
jgi:uncharacterized protein